ncbi:MAG TPA: hypothetical protein VGO58_16915 [Chitinophagaceae bacterium]|nr:hypothetical protein [Chitinophagaceae bacterium]
MDARQACLVFCSILLVSSCKEENSSPSKEKISEMDLRRGELISCGPPGKEFGTMDFTTSCGDKEKFTLAVKLLHSFEYEESEKVFAGIIDKYPGCAMAYWGVAMSNFHPLWAPPTEPELKKGSKAIEIAKSISSTTGRESAYIDAIAVFYKDWPTTDHRSRCLAYEKAMEALNVKYPDDKETAIFYALALTAAADPADKTFQKQKKAGTLLNALYPNEPDHPGIVHYIIHTYDYPELAELALPAARKYASVAPSSAHALHMPSHIFTRLGLWDECISSNLVSVSSAKCYAETAGLKGHWDEEMHGLDYLVYAYLQKGDNEKAQQQYDYLKTIRDVEPFNFKVAYAFAAIPARFALENKNWSAAAELKSHKKDIAWDKFPWQEAITHFARLLGAVHTNQPAMASVELNKLKDIHTALLKQKDEYKARQVKIQLKTGEAWIKQSEGKNEEALTLMKAAADLEDKTEKASVTPGEVLPAEELLGDMLMVMKRPAEALVVYEDNLKKHPNRFNGLYGAGLAAERSGSAEKAGGYYSLLMKSAGSLSKRPEFEHAKTFLMSRF